MLIILLFLHLNIHFAVLIGELGISKLGIDRFLHILITIYFLYYY